jgi:cobalt-zinc-cadmium efflux system outer membrane protein
VTLEEAVELFGKNGLPLRIARAEQRVARGEARQSRAYRNPTASFTREQLGRAGESYHETVATVGQRLEWPGRTAALIRASGRRIEAAEAAFRADSLQLMFELGRAYASAWAAEEIERALEVAAVTMADAVEAAERRYGMGDISGFALRRLRVEGARVAREHAVARLAATSARRRLGNLVLPGAEELEIGAAEPLDGTPPRVDRETALAALAGRPDLEAAAGAAEAARAAASAAAQAWVPAPTLTAGYKDQSDGFAGAALGLAIPLPLFDRRRGAAAAEAARAAAAAAALELRRREARSDLHDSYDRYASALEGLASIGRGLLGEADDLLEIARLAYDEGELELVELLDAAEAYRDARVMAVELSADAWVAYFDLARAMGGTEAAR